MGSRLSYLNYYDADAAWRLVHDLGDMPVCAIIKHANPCGVAVHVQPRSRYQRALECDERSAFGGIVALNRPIDSTTVERMVVGPQADVVIAPGYEPGAVEALQAKRKNTRILQAAAPGGDELDFRQIGWLPRAGRAPLLVSARRLAGRYQGRAAPRSSGATSSSRGDCAGT